MWGRSAIVDTRKTKLKAGYAAKTDRLDARRLADALRRESVVSIYYPPSVIRELRELCRHRLMLTQLRTRVLQRLRALLLRHGLGDPPVRTLRSVAGQTLAGRGRACPRARTTYCRRCDGWNAVSASNWRRWRPTSAAKPRRIRWSRACVRIRGVGPVVGLTLRAEIGDIVRFPTAGHLASYAGLVWRVDNSAMRTRYGRITKDGSPWLRWALGEIGLHALRRPDPVGRWGRKLALRKGRDGCPGSTRPVGVCRRDGEVAAGIILTRPASAHRLIITR